MSVSHSFSVEVACIVGERRAVILNNFAHWHPKNGVDQQHVHDGYVWTYNSIAGFAKVWPYLSEKEVRTALDGLERDGYLKTGNYNEWKIDRTKWYALTEKACELLGIDFTVVPHLPKRANANDRKGKSILPDGQTDLPQRADGFAPEGEPIPLENQIENTIQKESESAHESDEIEIITVGADEEKKGTPGGAATIEIVESVPAEDPPAPIRGDPFLRNRNAESLNVPFSVWYAAYDYNVNSEHCKRLWPELTDQERVTALTHSPDYVKAIPDKRYRKIPENYLIEKTFNDEIVPRHASKPSKNAVAASGNPFGQGAIIPPGATYRQQTIGRRNGAAAAVDPGAEHSDA